MLIYVILSATLALLGMTGEIINIFSTIHVKNYNFYYKKYYCEGV